MKIPISGELFVIFHTQELPNSTPVNPVRTFLSIDFELFVNVIVVYLARGNHLRLVTDFNFNLGYRKRPPNENCFR